jgi:hypothetical protein
VSATATAICVKPSNVNFGVNCARMHLAHSQSTGTSTSARDQKLRRPQISGSNVQNNSSFRYKDAVTSFFRSGQVRSGQVRCSRRLNFQYLKSALKQLGGTVLQLCAKCILARVNCQQTTSTLRLRISELVKRNTTYTAQQREANNKKKCFFVFFF